MAIGREWGMPNWKTGFIGICPVCEDDQLIFVLEDTKGRYYHCMNCNQDFEKAEMIQ